MREKDLDEPVDEAKAGDAEEDQPPPPEDEEVVLVEHIVGEKTENVLLVFISPNSASPHCAGDLGGKEVAHWVDRPCSLGQAWVWEEAVVGLHIDPEAGKFIIEERVQYARADQDANKVEELAEGKSKVVDQGWHGRISLSYYHLWSSH